MADWTQWWQGLSVLNQWFYIGAAFFSVLFLWQLISGFMGLIDLDDMDISHGDAGGFDHVEVSSHDAPSHVPHGHETVGDFKLLTFRSILAFFTLFTWAGALYLTNDVAPLWGVSYAMLWGLAAMSIVALIFWLLQRLVETGTPNLATCVGTRGVIYLDVPVRGDGEARVMVSGAVSHVKARAIGGGAIKAGTPVRVLRAVSATTIEVEPIEQPSSDA